MIIIQEPIQGVSKGFSQNEIVYFANEDEQYLQWSLGTYSVMNIGIQDREVKGLYFKVAAHQFLFQ